MPWLEFERFNAKKFSTIAAMSVAGVALVGPLAFVAAEAVGGAVGAYAGLSGAAATSHGLAVLGGGSLAAGGLGMAGGTVVVTAVGAGLGGASGASVAGAYVRSDKSFGFEKIADGGPTTVIFANGFLSEGKAGWGDWRRIVGERYPDATVYRLKWGAKELKSLTALIPTSATPLTARSAAAIAAQATKSSSRLIGPLGAAFTVAGVAKNPWHVARTRASMTGAVLADAIVRADLHSVVLVGFSLGGRVMTAAAESLATRQRGRSSDRGDAPPRCSRRYPSELALHRTGRRGTHLQLLLQERQDPERPLSRCRSRHESSRLRGHSDKSRKVKNINVSRMVGVHQDHLKAVSLR